MAEKLSSQIQSKSRFFPRFMTRAERLERGVRAYSTSTPTRRLYTRGVSLVLFVFMSLVCMAPSGCPLEDNVYTGIIWSFLAQLQGLSITHLAQHGPSTQAVRRSITGTNGSTGTAAFGGNFTMIAEPSTGVFAMSRLTDCSLEFLSVSSSTQASPSENPHFELYLHQLAQLTTKAGVFANGCVDPNQGTGSRPAVWVGKTSAGALAAAGAGPNGPTNAVLLYTLPSGGQPAHTTLTTTPYATALAVADLNGDKNNDVVVVNGFNAPSSSISVLLGNADGTFQAPVSYATGGNYTVAAVLDDVNGDGKADVVTVSGDQQISVLLGNGDGTFQAAKSFAAPALPGYASAASTPIASLITATLRSNGKKDIVASNGLVLLGNGDGTFTAAATPAFPYKTATSSEGPNLASGDVNRDGKPDLVVNNGSTVSVWLGNGDGTFKAGNSYATIADTGFVTVTDLDGDGNPDIYVGMANGGLFSADDSVYNAAYVLMGNGDGSFVGAPVTNTVGYSGTNLGDVNGDGVPDLITAGGTYGQGGATFTVQTGTGKGTFAAASTINAPASFTLNGTTITGANTAGPGAYAVGDLTGNGKADLVFADNNLTAGAVQYATPIYFVSLSNGDGTFTTPTPVAFPQIAPSGQFDNAATVSGMQIAGLKTSAPASLIFVFNERAGGTNVTSPYNQGFVVLPGNNNGTFGAPVITSTYSSATQNPTAVPAQIAAVTDLNGDGNSDLVVMMPSFSTTTGAQVSLEIFLGNGDGTFKAPTTLSTQAAISSVAIADFNGDSKPDIAYLQETSAGQAELAISLNTGSGAFGAATVLNLTGGDAIRSSSLAAGNFSGSGKMDLALVEPQAFSGVFTGNGDGTFASVNTGTYVVPNNLLNIGGSGQSIAVDLNKDGKPDILNGPVALLNLVGNTPNTTILSGTTTGLTASSTTVAQGTSVTLTATIAGASGSTGTPTGTVTFLNGTTTLGSGSANASGVATYTTTQLPVGSDNITAVYSGDSNFYTSTSHALTITVSTGPVLTSTTATLSASATSISAGQSVTFTATIAPQSGTGTPAGTVNFLDGATTLGSGTLNGSGVATFSTSSLAAGPHSITAAYQGNSSFAASTSSAVSVQVTAAPADFSASASPSTQSVTPGQGTSYTLTLTPSNGFSQSISVSCSGAPTGAACTPASASVTPSGSGASTDQVNVTTSAPSTAVLKSASSAPWQLAALLGLSIFGAAAGRVRRRFWGTISVLVVLVGGLALAAATGCGGGGGTKTPTGGTPAGSYALTLTATSGSTTHTTTITLVVQ